jgi:membrane protease YdiL (CAAX protease family)
MRIRFEKLLHWRPAIDTLVAFILGLVVIALSVIMTLTTNAILKSIVIRDILMILIFGILIPLFIIQSKNEFKEFGFHIKHWYIYLPINLVLGLLLLMMFLKVNPPGPDFSLTTEIFWRIFYIMLAGVFELIFYYCYLRTIFEKAFGIIPAIILTALFYSFHHAGFQPEFIKLFFVGIFFATVFRIGNSILLLYPFFWGVGACYDVLIQFLPKTGLEFVYPELRVTILLLGIIIITILLIINNKIKIAHNYANSS